MIRTLAALAVVTAAAVAQPAPGEVIIDEIEGYDVLDDRLSLDLADYREWAPELVDHLDPATDASSGMQGAFRIWGGDGIDGVIVNVTLWPELDLAARYVDRVAREAAALGLRPESSPFEGVLRFGGTDDTGAALTYLAWRDDRYGVAMVGVGAGLGEVVVAAARDQQALLDTATGGEVTPTDTPPGDDGERNRLIGTIAFFAIVAVAVGGFWFIIRMKRRARDAAEQRSAGERRERSVDEIIDGARAERRGADEPAPLGTDDIVAEARRQAREEVEAASDAWQTPDET